MSKLDQLRALREQRFVAKPAPTPVVTAPPVKIAAPEPEADRLRAPNGSFNKRLYQRKLMRKRRAAQKGKLADPRQP